MIAHRLAAVVLLVAGALGARSATAQPATVTEPGALAGTVRFVGTPPRLGAVTISKDQHVCGEERTPEVLVVGPDGGVRDAVIRIEAVEDGRKSEAELVLDIRQCRFVPHVAGIAVGTRVRIRNSDPVVHTARGTTGREVVFYVGLPGDHQDVDVTRHVVEPGVIHVRSDAHPVMSAWLVVHDTPYIATTDASGTFRIEGIPPGRYTVTLWHEGFRAKGKDADGRPVYAPPVKMAKKVTIEPKATSTVDFEIKGTRR